MDPLGPIDRSWARAIRQFIEQTLREAACVSEYRGVTYSWTFQIHPRSRQIASRELTLVGQGGYEPLVVDCLQKTLTRLVIPENTLRVSNATPEVWLAGRLYLVI